MPENQATNNAAANEADREIVVSRVFDAPRELVFKAWTEPQHLVHWWGPKGFTNTVKQIDVRPGGVWRYVMHGPDGTDYENTIVYNEVVQPERIVYSHGESENDPDQFQVTVTMAEQGNKTHLTMRMLFKSAAARDMVVKEYGAIEGANSTLDRLEELLASM
jgi:uncharacterized protein YndB with AHSA1/START domain